MIRKWIYEKLFGNVSYYITFYDVNLEKVVCGDRKAVQNEVFHLPRSVNFIKVEKITKDGIIVKHDIQIG